MVIRKKFSWKDYPELEDYLIAHREEYLKHSNNMNYTAAQKEFNNQLTEGLLETARSHMYAFDTAEFDFVAIRDRIRCYYKSYVQTKRKRELMHSPAGSNRKGKKKAVKGPGTGDSKQGETQKDQVKSPTSTKEDEAQSQQKPQPVDNQ